MSKRLAAGLLAIAILFPVGHVEATQFSTDGTDLYWNPNESGWGLQVVQEADVIFVTLYVYDPGNPIWYTGTGIAQTNSTSIWAGDLYQTTGPWFGAPVFNPALVTTTKVGTLTLDHSASVNTARPHLRWV